MMRPFLEKNINEELVKYSKKCFAELPLDNKSKNLLLGSLKKIPQNYLSYAVIGGNFAYDGGFKGMSDIDMGLVFNSGVINNKSKLKQEVTKFIKIYKSFNLKNGFVPDYLFPGEYMSLKQVEDAIKGRGFKINTKLQRLEIPILTNDDFLQDYERWFQVWLTLNAFSIYIFGDINAFLRNKLLSWRTIILYLLSNTSSTEIDEKSVLSLITSTSLKNHDFRIDESYRSFKSKEFIYVKYANLHKYA